jgi:hypothetical protein
MRPVSTSFLNAVRGSHRAVFRATVVSPGQTGVSPIGVEINILGGSVVFDTNADINATLDLTTDIDWPTLPDSVGSPYGQEVYVERGVAYGNGTTEWVGLGYFRIDTVEQVQAPKGQIRITGSDRMANVVDGRPLQPIQFPVGTSVGAMLDFVIGEVVIGVDTVYDWDAYSELLISDHILDDDRMKFVREILDAYGKVGYNAVVATGEPVGDIAPVRGVALDLDENSPTYWEGDFGKVPRFFSSSFLVTDGQAGNAARAILLRSTGLPYVVELGVVPNPALEGWDVVRVKFGPHDIEIHVLDRIEYALSVDGEMVCETRKQYLNS